jgi:hypothetical protein
MEITTTKITKHGKHTISTEVPEWFVNISLSVQEKDRIVMNWQLREAIENKPADSPVIHVIREISAEWNIEERTLSNKLYKEKKKWNRKT